MADAPKPKPVTTQEAAQAVKQVAKQAAKVTESAAHLEASAGAVERSADIQTLTALQRTTLAADRTVLAAERTYAAWMRTGLAGLAAGLGAHALLDGQLPRWLVVFVASILLLFAAFSFAVGLWRQTRAVGDPAPNTPRIPTPVLTAVSGMLIAVSLAALLVVIAA